jgi:hypothetical protein
MKPNVLDNVGKREQNSAQILANNSCSQDWDFSVRFIQQPTLYNHIPERIGRILGFFDFANVNWNEDSSCLYIKIKDEYKRPYNLPLFEIKKIAKKISRFLLIKDIQNYYLTIEIYKGKYSAGSDRKIVYRDFVTPNNTIDVKALIDFIYLLPVQFKA